MSIFMMLHNRCRSDTLSRSSAMSTRGISRGMYFWAKMNLARASRPPGVELAARVVLDLVEVAQVGIGEHDGANMVDIV
jgi:hypothetical protein